MKYTSHDNQLYRQERLIKVEKVAAAILGMTIEQLRKHVVQLHDQKGTLVVSWNNETPTPTQKHAFSSAWSLSGESPDCVAHQSGGVA